MKKTPETKARTKLEAELAALEAMPDSAIDLIDMPEVIDWSGAVRGKFYRPIKQQITLRMDADIVHWLKAKGGAYQTRINTIMRQAMLKDTSV
jgi:uncharacterized protein (DUF4415 family)